MAVCVVDAVCFLGAGGAAHLSQAEVIVCAAAHPTAVKSMINGRILICVIGFLGGSFFGCSCSLLGFLGCFFASCRTIKDVTRDPVWCIFWPTLPTFLCKVPRDQPNFMGVSPLRCMAWDRVFDLYCDGFFFFVCCDSMLQNVLLGATNPEEGLIG